jgi:hypothetical protein
MAKQISAQNGIQSFSILEWNSLGVRVADINLYDERYTFFCLLKHNGSFIVNSMYRHLVKTGDQSCYGCLACEAVSKINIFLSFLK